MGYGVKIENFEGPMDLLLQLIESEKLEIANVSLAQVTEPFVAHVRENQGKIAPEELADFLVIAAKLVYLKSKILLPYLSDAELDEGPDLETQLRMYKAFVEAAAKIDALAQAGNTAYGRSRRMTIAREPQFIPPPGVTNETLHELFVRVVRRLEPILQLPKAAIERVVTLEEKISQLIGRVKKLMHVSFHRFLSEAGDRHEMIVSFLALLELVKQRTITYEQQELFQDIRITHSA